MPVEMSWNHNISPGGSVLVVSYIGEWTWQEYLNARNAESPITSQLNSEWVIIHDTHRQKQIPLDALPRAVDLMVREADPLVKMQILIGISALTVRLYSMFVQMLPSELRSQFRVAATLEIAHEYVRQALSEAVA